MGISSSQWLQSYSKVASTHLNSLVERNRSAMDAVVGRLVESILAGQSLFVFGSGHSALFPMELYHRAGGASFVIPMVAEWLLPTAGPKVVRAFERQPGSANLLLDRHQVKKGEMLWIASQSGINGSVVDFAMEAHRRGIFTVGFTSLTHSQSVPSRHPSSKKLFEVVDAVIDLGGFSGDACVALPSGISAGPLSTLSMTWLGHSLLVAACAELEARGQPCVYTSVNTPEGESRNRSLEERAAERDFALR